MVGFGLAWCYGQRCCTLKDNGKRSTMKDLSNETVRKCRTSK